MLTVLKVIPYVCFVALFAAALHIMKDIDCCTYAQSIWINKDNDTLSTSSANGKMRVDVEPASSVNETLAHSPWSVISTDFIPIKKGGVHNYSLDISANNTNLLHSKVIYYDSAKNETFWKFIFSGKNGTFNEQFNNSIFSPPETEYVKLQILVRPSLTPSFYVINDVKIVKVNTDTNVTNSSNNISTIRKITQ